MVVVVDYGMGNLKSVNNSALFLGERILISSSATTILKAKKIIIPGVGHFAMAVKELNKNNIFDVLKEKINSQVPVLGICLGMQLLFDGSQEAPGARGLGAIKGMVKKIPADNLIVPHMGWNTIKKVIVDCPQSTGRLLRGVKDKSFFYFAHSYYCCPEEKEAVSATTEYGKINFASVVNKKNVWGVQFHPEKSQKEGLKILNNFLKNRF